eukprot:GILJ01011433.1.p1 GENE.GILJ01011433.1~~GILJ01011433.1.p1  ORF type:complete len:111 (+),score=4.67 GILJ01011433.1:193-525(+)
MLLTNGAKGIMKPSELLFFKSLCGHDEVAREHKNDRVKQGKKCAFWLLLFLHFQILETERTELIALRDLNRVVLEICQEISKFYNVACQVSKVNLLLPKSSKEQKINKTI